MKKGWRKKKAIRRKKNERIVEKKEEKNNKEESRRSEYKQLKKNEGRIRIKQKKISPKKECI